MKRINILLINITLILTLVGAVVFGVLFWLKSYTRHNDVVEIPDITGMKVAEATQVLEAQDLTLVIADSVFNMKMAPGIILETTPKVGSMIKRQRSLFVIVNATGVLKRQVPDVNNVSLRQAMATLRAAGFESITVKYVGGAHNDLVLALRTESGRLLSKGENIPYNTALVLEVSISDPSLMMREDSLMQSAPVIIEETEDENWF